MSYLRMAHVLPPFGSHMKITLKTPHPTWLALTVPGANSILIGDDGYRYG